MISIKQQDAQKQEDRIERLASEAAEAGDLEQLALCRRALSGDEDAWDACVDVIADAEAEN